MSQFRIEAVGRKHPVPKMASKEEVDDKLKWLWWYCWGQDKEDWTPAGEFNFRERDPSDPVFRVRDFEREGGLDLLGTYRRHDSLVTIYIDSCLKAARSYKVEYDHLVEVVLTHELAHLMTHRGFEVEDLSSGFMEHTAQCATYAYLKLRNGEALKVFELLSPHQPFVYRTWESLKALPTPAYEIFSRPDHVQAVVQAFFLAVRHTLRPSEREEGPFGVGYDK
jgi:hypothetical protein